MFVDIGVRLSKSDSSSQVGARLSELGCSVKRGGLAGLFLERHPRQQVVNAVFNISLWIAPRPSDRSCSNRSSHCDRYLSFQ